MKIGLIGVSNRNIYINFELNGKQIKLAIDTPNEMEALRPELLEKETSPLRRAL